MADHFDEVKHFLLDLGYTIDQQIEEEEIVIVTDQEKGINNLIVDCEEDLLVIEQLIMEFSDASADVYRRLLQMNRHLIHGAFVIDDDGTKLLFRNTLALDNLDRNELETTLNALSIGLAEFGEELLSFRN